VLLHTARVLDAQTPATDYEVAVEVELLATDATSFRAIRERSGGDPQRIANSIAGIVAQRGKPQNPWTGSGGVLMGRVLSVGSGYEVSSLHPGQRVVPLASLIAIPLRLDAAREPRSLLPPIRTARVVACRLALLGLGFLNVTVALVVLAIPPILTNAFVGIAHVQADAVDAAHGMGTKPFRVLLDIEFPLALPLVFGGIRTAAVLVVARTPLRAIAGGGALGDIIVNQPTYGLQGVLGAAITLTALAFATDFALATVERGLIPRGLRPRARRTRWLRWRRRADIDWHAASGGV
jgi:ABC-type proline/glycine betaine transport system permease subunit